MAKTDDQRRAGTPRRKPAAAPAKPAKRAKQPKPAVPQRGGPMGTIEGADRAAVGTAPEPASAPPGAAVDAAQHLVPGANFDDRPRTAKKPWFTSLGAESEQAGVGNDPSDERA